MERYISNISWLMPLTSDVCDVPPFSIIYSQCYYQKIVLKRLFRFVFPRRITCFDWTAVFHGVFQLFFFLCSSYQHTRCYYVSFLVSVLDVFFCLSLICVLILSDPSAWSGGGRKIDGAEAAQMHL